MKKKTVVILEVLILLISAVIYFYVEVLPDFKKSLGSSDKLINTKKYQNMIEFNIDNNTNFALVLNKDKKVYHIFFFSKTARCLYNKNIENKDYSKSLDIVVNELIENQMLTTTSSIIVTKYNDNNYSEFIKTFKLILNKYNIETNVIEKVNTLEDKAKYLRIDNKNNDSILREIDFYSREFLRVNVGEKNNIIITDSNILTYTNNVYKKIENYVINNNIKTQEKNSEELIINLIPADSNGKYYPSSNSYYYVREGKVYAYIEIDNKGYCYKGSINNYEKGECK